MLGGPYNLSKVSSPDYGPGCTPGLFSASLGLEGKSSRTPKWSKKPKGVGSRGLLNLGLPQGFAEDALTL